MIRASIDIGSNSILLLVAHIEKEQIKKVLESHSRITSLGYELDEKKVFHDSSMNKSLEVFKEYFDICKKYQLDSEDVIVTATEASRVATNAISFFEKIESQTGFKTHIISSFAEAYYSTRGIMLDIKTGTDHCFILDIGGASSEVIKACSVSKKPISSFSFPMGAVRVTDWFDKSILENELIKVKEQFREMIKDHQTTKLFCVAGTMTSVANMILGHSEFKEQNVHKFQMDVSKVDEIYNKIEEWEQNKILEEFPFLGKRARTIKGGLLVALRIFEWLRVDKLEVSTYGLRYGTILEGRIEKEYLHARS